MKRSETVPFIPSPLLTFRRWIVFMTSPTHTEGSGRVSECSGLLISSSVCFYLSPSDLAHVKIWRYLLAKTSAISLSRTYPSTEFAVFLLTLLIVSTQSINHVCGWNSWNLQFWDAYGQLRFSLKILQHGDILGAHGASLIPVHLPAAGRS